MKLKQTKTLLTAEIIGTRRYVAQPIDWVLKFVNLDFDFQIVIYKAGCELVQPDLNQKEKNMEGTIGEIKLFSGNFEPRDWHFCDGKILDINNNTALFSILGNKYGGDGRETFALPDLNPLQGAKTKTPADDLNYIICLQGIYPSRN